MSRGDNSLLKVLPKTIPTSAPFSIEDDVCWEVFIHLISNYFDLHEKSVLQYRPVMIKEENDKQWIAFLGDQDKRKLYGKNRGSAIYVRVTPSVRLDLLLYNYLIAFHNLRVYG